MNFNQFRIFAAVARYRHITKASRALKVSQSSISRQLRSLETAYKVKLYHSMPTGGIELTDEGQLFLSHVHSILSYLRTLDEIFHSHHGSKAAKLSVAGNYSASATLLPTAVRLFKKLRPGTKVDFKTANSNNVAQMILNSEADIGVVKNWKSFPLIAAEPYLYQKALCVVSKNHPLAKKKNPSFSDITATPFVVLGWKWGQRSIEQQIIRDLNRKGYKIKIGLICGSPGAVDAAVKLQMGVGILFEDWARPGLRSGKFKEIKLPGVARMGALSSIVWHKKKPLSSDALEFRRILVELCKKKRNVKSNPESRHHPFLEWTRNQSDS